jgi:hypothetical protein
MFFFLNNLKKNTKNVLRRYSINLINLTIFWDFFRFFKKYFPRWLVRVPRHLKCFVFFLK